MDYIVRNATAQDVSEIIRLEQASLTAAHWNLRTYEALFADQPFIRRLALVALERATNIPVGFLIARHVSKEWELENIVVAEAKRGIGIGTSLLSELLLRATTNENGVVFLEVRASNTAARGLYTKMGFEESGRRIDYYSDPPEDAVLYSKMLQNKGISG